MADERDPDDAPEGWEELQPSVMASDLRGWAERLRSWSVSAPLVHHYGRLVALHLVPWAAPPWVNAMATWPKKPGSLRAQLVEVTLRSAGRDPQWAAVLEAAYALGGLCGVRDLAAAELTPGQRWRVRP